MGGGEKQGLRAGSLPQPNSPGTATGAEGKAVGGWEEPSSRPVGGTEEEQITALTQGEARYTLEVH